MLNKPLVVAAIAATVATATLSMEASAGDPVLGALLGGGVGAAIGHNINGRDGAWVGGALGAVTGASIAANSRGYYDSGYYVNNGYYGGAYYGNANTYYAPAPVYYAPPSVYYAPAPVYYARPAVVYRSAPVYVRSYQPRYVDYGRGWGHVRYDRWDGHGHHHDGWHR